MRPLAILLGIVMGSAVAVTLALSMTAIVFALLPEYSVRTHAEMPTLLRGLCWGWSLALLGAAGFVGELRHHRLRRWPQLALLVLLSTLLFVYRR